MRTTLYLKGQVIDEPKFICEVDEKQIFAFLIRTVDMERFPVRMSKGLMEKFGIEKGKTVHLSGYLQSSVEKASGKNSLYCFCDMIEWRWDEDRLLHMFHGYICKEPLYSKSGDKEKVSFLLSVERDSKISDYIPCVVDGDAVELIKEISIGERIVVVGGLEDDKELKESVFKVNKIARCGAEEIKETLNWLYAEEKNRKLYYTAPYYELFQVLCDVNPQIKYNPQITKIKSSDFLFDAIVFYLAEECQENEFIEKSFLDFFNTVKKQHICIAYQGDSNCMLNTDAIYDLYMHPPISEKELLEAYEKWKEEKTKDENGAV